MSQENVATFKRVIEAYNRREIEPLLETSDPEIEWYPFTAQVEGDEAYHGHEGLRQWWANIDAAFEDFEASVDEVRDLDDTVVATRSPSRPIQERRQPGYRDRLGYPLP